MGERERNTEAIEYVQMGQNLMGVGKFAEAVEMFDKALKADPMDKLAYICKGIAFASMERFAEAKECFKRTVMIDNTFADGYFQLGNMEFLEDHFEEGVKNYNKAVSFGYRGAELYYNLGLVYEEREEIEEAIRCYSKAAAADETTPVYLIRKASLQVTIGKYEESLQTLEKIRICFPESFEGYHLAAAAHTMLEQYEEADAILKKATELFPEDTDLLFDRVRVLITKKDLASALEMLAKAKEKESRPEIKKEMLFNEAQILGQQEKLNDAIVRFNEALEIPEAEELNPEICYFLMNAYLVNKDFQGVLKTAEKMDRDDIDNPFSLSAVYYKGIALKGLNDSSYKKYLQDAVKYYRNISIKDPSRVDVWLFRAMCCKETGDYAKALEAVDYVLLIQPEDGKIHYIKSNILKEMGGREQDAEKERREALRLGMDNSLLI